MKKFSKLLEKDWRIYRGPIIGLVILTLLPYFANWEIEHFEAPRMVERTITSQDKSTHPPRTVHVKISYYKGPYALALGRIEMATGMGVFLAIIMAPVFGACAFAIERRDRSADFLAMLPIRRRTIISSKFWLAFLLLILASAIEWLMGIGLSPSYWIWGPARIYVSPLDIYLSWALQFSIGLGMFGLAWLISAISESPVLAAVIPIGAAVLAMAWIILWSVSVNDVNAIIKASCVIGVAGLVLGNFYYLKRVSP